MEFTLTTERALSEFMRKILLHIGRHKTGTTAIQHFLRDNRAALRAAGWVVPESGRVNAGHHGFSEPLSPRSHQAGSDPSELPVFGKLRRELESEEPDQKVVISSEAFQNCQPELVRRAFHGYEVTLIVYLRDQVAYLPTAYAQRVHASNLTDTLDQYYQGHFRNTLNYFAFLKQWESAFDGRIIVRVYQASDTVADFCEHGLYLNSEDFSVRSGNSNPSLNSVVTEFKRQVNCLPESARPDPASIYYLLPKLNEVFPAPKLSASDRIAEDIRKECRASNTKVAKRFFSRRKLFDGPHATGDSSPHVDGETFDKMMAALKELMVKYPTPKSARDAR